MPRKRPVICDECVSSRVAEYLREMGEEVIEIRDSSSDSDIRRLGHQIGAYIVTKDRGFRNYQRYVPVSGRERPERVYKLLMEMERSER